MNTQLKTSALLLLAFCYPAAAGAADLMDVFQRAERFDPRIHAARAEYQATEQGVPQSRAALLPQLSGSLTESTSETEVDRAELAFIQSSDGDTSGYALNLSQTIYNHGHWQRLKQANINAARAEADYNADRQALIVRVAEAYFGVLAAQDSLEFAQAEKNSVEQQLEQAKQRFDVGLIAITDVKESQAQYDQAVASEIEARNALSTRREALWSIIRSYPEQLHPLKADIPLLKPEPADKQHWVDKALADNLSLLAARFAREAADEEVDLQRSGHFPSLELSARRNYSDSDAGTFGATEQTETSVALTLNVPIFSGGGTHARVKEAMYRLEAARQQQEATRRQTVQQTRDAYQNVIADISRVKALKQSLVSSQAAYEATEAGFEVGTRNSVEVLTSLRNVFRAKRDYAQTRYDYILDLLRLKQAAGSLNMQDLQAVNRWLD